MIVQSKNHPITFIVGATKCELIVLTGIAMNPTPMIC